MKLNRIRLGFLFRHVPVDTDGLYSFTMRTIQAQRIVTVQTLHFSGADGTVLQLRGTFMHLEEHS